MSLLLTWNGQNYIIPQTNEVGWGSNLDDFFTALPAGALQKTGGSFTLSSEVDFGSAYGLKTLYYKSRTVNPASVGQVRLASADVINFRNNANGADISISKDASDNLQWNAKKILLSGDVVNADINASAAIAYSKLTLTGSVVDADVSASAAIARSKIATGTAYTLLTNSSTGAVSEVSGVGSTGQVLTSNGAGALPTFQNVAGTGTVNSGTTTQVAYYASSTNAVSGNSHLTITSGGSLVTGPSAGLNLRMGNQTFTNAGGVIEFARPDDGAYSLAVGQGAAPNDDGVISVASGGSLLRLGATGGITFYVNETFTNLFASTRPSATLMVKIITGQVQFPDGSAGAPGVSFLSATGLGFYNDSGDLKVTVAGTAKQGWNGTALYPTTNAGYDLGTSGFRYGTVYANSVVAANTGISVGGNQTYPIVQVKSTIISDPVSTTSASLVDTTLAVTITPKFSTSKFLIAVHGSVFSSNAASNIRVSIHRAVSGGSTTILPNAIPSTFLSYGNTFDLPVAFSYYDTIAPSTSAITYTVCISSSGGNSVTWGSGLATQSMIVQEIAQ